MPRDGSRWVGRLAVLLLGALVLPFTPFATGTSTAVDSASISGTITDEFDQPLQNASVLFDSGSLEGAVQSQADGTYLLAPLPAGNYTLTVYYLGRVACYGDPTCFEPTPIHVAAGQAVTGIDVVVSSSDVSQCVPSAPPRQLRDVFNDVPPDHPFCEDIQWLVAAGITTGYPDGTFRPGAPVTRAAMAAFIYRYSGEPDFTPPSTPTFSDVPKTHPFYKEIEWLSDAGLTDGFPNGTYHPSGSITRQAMAAFLYRLAGLPDFTTPPLPSFPDVPTDHPFLKEIEWLAWEDITGGFADGGFHPDTSVTRQATAAFLYRFNDNIGLP